MCWNEKSVLSTLFQWGNLFVISGFFFTFPMTKTFFHFDSESQVTFHAEKTQDAVFEPETWCCKNGKTCLKHWRCDTVLFLLFGNVLPSCALLGTSHVRGNRAKERLPAESEWRIEGRSLGFVGLSRRASTGTRVGCTEWKSSNGKGIRSRGVSTMGSGHGRKGGRFVCFWTASTMREEGHSELWTHSHWGAREQAGGGGRHISWNLH